MRLFSWNTGGRTGRTDEQIAAITECSPDVVCLQEIRHSTADAFKVGLASAGLVHALDSLLAPEVSECSARSRQTGTMIVSRWPLQTLPAPMIPWQEKALSALVVSPAASFEVHTVHVPPGASNGWIKIETFQGVFSRLACTSGVARILCGDLNSPQRETPEGRIITWGEDEVDGRIVYWGTYKGRTGREWDAGERSVLEGLAQFDLCDVFRGLHGFGIEAFSWYLKRKRQVVGRRFDHIFASQRFHVHDCRYLHALREAHLSDHSPIQADLDGPR